MQIHVEVVIEGQRERQRIATIQRSADLAAVDGLGLTLTESKDLLARLQATVAHQHADELIAANSACGGCGQPLARKGTSPIVLSHRVRQGQPEEPAVVLAMSVRRQALW